MKMKNQVIEKEIGHNNASLSEGEIKVETKFYDGYSCDFTISAKNINNAKFYGLAKMFAVYFACLKLQPYKTDPKLSEKAIKNIKPIAIALFREFGRQDLGGEEKGKQLLEEWTNQVFQLMQSDHGIH